MYASTSLTPTHIVCTMDIHLLLLRWQDAKPQPRVAVSAFCAYYTERMRMVLYIDGFNLFYGCLKGTPYKWLDVAKMCHFLFPHDTIVKVKYFTAPIKIRAGENDVGKPNRQQIYLRALRTVQNLEVHEGHFLSHIVTMKNADGSGFTKVVKTEEKGTDVNIAANLVHDGHTRLYDRAVVISNDSDLVEPIRIVTQELNRPVIVVNPYERNSDELKKTASSVRRIRKGVLRLSQFPGQLTDTVGTFRKPASW